MKLGMKITVPALGLLVAGVLTWQWYQRHFPSWNEEVLLADGRLLSVHRAETFNTEGALVETALTINLPEIGGTHTWRESLHPAIVNAYQGKVYVVGRVTYRSASQYKHPKYGYVAFVYAAPNWQRVPFMSVPEPIRAEENIAHCAPSIPIRTWREKQTGWCSLRGVFVKGANRKIDLAANERNAKEMAELANTNIKSE